MFISDEVWPESIFGVEMFWYNSPYKQEFEIDSSN